MLTEERAPVGAMSGSGGGGTSSSSTARVAGRSRPPWLLTVDDLPSIPSGGRTASARFSLEDLVSPSSGGARRGTGAFLPCVQMQSHPPLPQPVPRPSGKPNPANGGAGTTGSNKKKPRPSPATPSCGGGPGMHAVFIDPASRPSGTGVFLPRSTAATDQLLCHQSQQHKRPPVTSSRVLLPARLFRRVLANQHAPTFSAHPGGPPDQVPPLLLKGDKIHNHHHRQRQQSRGEGGKRGTADAAALYDQVQGDYPDNDTLGTGTHSNNNNNKCAVPMHDYTASTLIEKLLPEEWSY